MALFVAHEAISPDEDGIPVVRMSAASSTDPPEDVQPVDPSNPHHLQMAIFAQEGADHGASCEAIASRFGSFGYLTAA